MAAAVCLCLAAVACSEQINALAGENGIAMEYETALFDTDEAMQVNILMDEDEWKEMLENAIEEEYYSCDVEINGKTFYKVGIRPKGNTSLSSIASDPTTDRYSFKLEFDHYVEGQTCYGLDKLILNNNYADATNMKEALIYDMFRYLGADASLYHYAGVSVNGEYWGCYLALEGVEDSFLLRNYGAADGELYKPESMEMGNGGGGPENGDEKKAFQGMEQGESSEMEQGESSGIEQGERPEMEQGERPEMGQGAAPDDRNQMPGGMEAAAPSGVSSNLIWSAISFGVLVLALLFAVLFKRRPRRR